MKKSNLCKVLATLLAVLMIVGILPLNVFALDVNYSDSNGGSNYYQVISQKNWDIAPGVKETEIVLNNTAGTRRQVLHTAVVDVNNPYVKVIPGYKGMWPEEGNYGTESTSAQALNAEKLGYGNVVVATNASLSWYTSEYYKQNPHLIGEPLGYSILDGQYYENSQGQAGGGPKTVTVINYDYHPITGEKRPDDMPKVWIRGINDPLTGWEEQAIPVLFTYLVKPDANGKPVNQYKEDHGSGIASRTFVGVKADGTLVLAVSDGEQAPYSTGFTNYEMAEYMIKMGCVIAANCDGGGSTTFCSQRPGEDLKVNCSLSDGGERPTTNTFLVISTAPADGVFARATLETEYNYYTPGSSVTFNALGTDAVGTKVDIPADVQWQVKEEGMGTVSNGVFTSNGTEGTVTVQMVYDGNIVGEKTITIITPEELTFEQPIVTIPFGKTAKIPVKAIATINDVKQEISLSRNDVTFTTTNPAIGQFNGLDFIAVDETAAPEDITSTITATLNMGTNPTTTVQLNLGRASQVLWDFEGGQADIDVWNVINNRKNAAHWDYYLNLSLADRNNGQVHDGNYSMRLETNGLSSKDSHSEQYAWIRLGVDGEPLVLENARSVGFWLYVPEDNIQCWVQGHYKTDSNGDGVFDTDNVVSIMESENVYYNIDESGWHYLSMDISSFEKIALQADKQYDKDPSDGMTGEKGEFFLALVFHKAINNKLWQENGSINGNYTYYLDNFTVDYSEAVDDRENPVFDKVYLDGTTALIKRDVVTTTNNVLNLSVAVADASVRLDANKNEVPLYNASGLNVDSAKVYVDGVEVASTFANGVLSANNISVADGYHRVKFEICDNAGNKSVVIRVVKVESGVEKSTLNLVPADSTLDKIPFGSVYWMNLEATAIETIQSVSTVIDLNNVNHWELDHMELAEGFTAEYTINEETNTANITITRTGENIESGASVLAKLPVRILYFDTDIKTPGYTAETYWTTYPFWAQDMKMDVDMGLITYVDKSTSTFSNEEFHVDTEMYTSMANMDKAYFTEHGTTHVHTPVALSDKAPTCTENGYTGRTFCEGCNSVVEWGTTIPALGHTYEIKGDKIACECGRTSTATGLQTINGKNYYAVNGSLLNGWQMVDEDWYFFDKKTYEGIDGQQYTEDAILFTFDNGRVTEGTWVKTINGMRYWYGPSYYKDTSFDADSCKPYEIDGKTYLFSRQGYMQTGIVYFFTGVYDGISGEALYYDCAEDGTATLLTGPYNNYFYKDGEKVTGYQLIQDADNNYYFISDGHKLAKNCKIYLASKYTNGHNYNDGRPMSEGYFTFDSEGKMVIKNGVIDGYLYIDDVKQTAYKLVKYDGNYYFVSDGHKVAVNTTMYLASRFTDGHYYDDGTPMTAGYYTFDSTGKLDVNANTVENKNGIYDGFLYINNVKQKAYKLVKHDGNYYFISDGHKIAVNTTMYLASRFTDGHYYDDGTPMTAGYYTFDATGKMVNQNGVYNGFLYINNVKQKAYKLVKYDGNYYFISDGHKVAVNTTMYLASRFTDGHYYDDGTPMTAGNYTFDATGKMVNQNGVYNGFLYINNVKQKAYKLVKYDGNYYFISDGHKVAVNTTMYLASRFTDGHYYDDGTPMTAGNYTFDNDGKMIVKNGVYDGYLYVNNVKQKAYQLVYCNDAFYFVSDGHKVTANTKIWLSSKYVIGKAYPDGTMIEVGYHYFDETGKMIY